MTESARVLVYTEGPFAGKQRIADTEFAVGTYDPVRREDGFGLGAYRIEEVGDGIARTKWIEGWDAFLRDLREAEGRQK